jgi:murein L,D-transpeptidase YcbB/YkuD
MNLNGRTALWVANGLAAAALVFLIAVAVMINLHRPPTSLDRHLTSLGFSGGEEKDLPAAIQKLMAGQTGQDADMVHLYVGRSYQPVWFRSGKLTTDALQTVKLLALAGDEGLPTDRYHVAPVPDARSRDEEKAAFELSLTKAVWTYARDMHAGVTKPSDLFQDVSLPAPTANLAPQFETAASEGAMAAFTRGLSPSSSTYAALRTALKQYRSIAARGGWPTVEAQEKVTPDNLAKLQARLQAEGYSSQGADGASVLTAFKAYQAASGMTPDGHLDRHAADMLNIPAGERADQIAVNMERWRWLPRDLGPRYVWVNVPDASLAVEDLGAVPLVSRVVVGAPDKQTPILVTRAVAVTVNPVWHVPKSIVEKEIKPKLAGNPDYLEQKNMVSTNGEIIQQAGPDNALGVAKFEMPNPFDVYLHDTPSKHAFLSDERALSHGCVRVEAIRPLVERLAGLKDAELNDLVAAGQTKSLRLKEPVPVYILYWTAIAQQNGHIVFRPDVYGRDARMIAVMFPSDRQMVVASQR